MNSRKDQEPEHFEVKRIKICQNCEHYKAFICSKCGCFMLLKTKIKQTWCPIGKWYQEI